MNDDLDKLEDKIERFKAEQTHDEHTESAKEIADRTTGMRAGSEFIAYVFSGAFVGWLIGTWFGNMALWLILLMFIGFGLGVWRASQTMK